MKALMKKEIRLSASVLTYIFIVAGAMTLIPGYPVLCGAFFVTLGIFYSFQNSREANDIVYTILLPIAKRDVVKGKFIFSIMIEMAGFLVMAVLTILRMTVFSEAVPYRENVLMNANPFFLGMALIIFGLFNFVFIAGFFKTAYKFTPFVTYIITTFLTIGIAETVHHIPNFSAVNAFGTEHLGLQLILLSAGAAIYVILTIIGYKISCRRFENIDL